MMINLSAAACSLLYVVASTSSQFEVAAAVHISGSFHDAIQINNNHSIERRQQVCNCISTIDQTCHPNPDCRDNPDKCTNPKGKDKCNESGTYEWQTQSTPSPSPAPTSPPAPSSSCGKCVADNYTTPCSAPTDCPTQQSPGTCSAPSPQPTNGNFCTLDDECEPSSGKPRNRGTCNGGSITNTECDTTLTCSPTNAPVPPTSPVRIFVKCF